MTTPKEKPPNPNMQNWTALARPPVHALKEIKGGRLSGMTDVNPQWRYQVMTEQFGMCGVGWKYTIDRLWTEQGAEGEILGFAQVSLMLKTGDGWTEPIVGVGGNHLVTKEKSGLRNNDECWKMAVTDALSVAMKMIGVAADIYAGRWDGAKYRDVPQDVEPQVPSGFDEWLMDINAVADEGLDALKAAWSKSKPEYRKYLTSTNNALWESLKAKAARHAEPVSA